MSPDFESHVVARLQGLEGQHRRLKRWGLALLLFTVAQAIDVLYCCSLWAAGRIAQNGRGEPVRPGR